MRVVTSQVGSSIAADPNSALLILVQATRKCRLSGMDCTNIFKDFSARIEAEQMA
jgi:hypothetical protein